MIQLQGVADALTSVSASCKPDVRPGGMGAEGPGCHENIAGAGGDGTAKGFVRPNRLGLGFRV